MYIVYYAQHEPNINGTPYEVKIKYGEKEEVYEGEIEFDLLEHRYLFVHLH